MTGNVQAEGDSDDDRAIVLPPMPVENYDCLYLYKFLVHMELFGGLPHEDPNLHIKNFLYVCALHNQNNFSDDTLRLILFPLSLQGETRDWFNDLPARSIHNWDDLLETFLGEFFPLERMVELRFDLLNFKQKPHEALYEAWMRYKKYLKKCPKHECTDVLLLQTFYFALDKENRSLADIVAKGAILELTFPHASAILDKVAKQAHAWDTSWSDVSYGSSNSTISQKNEARDETIAQLSTQITLLTKQIAELNAEKDANYVSSYQGGPNQQRTNYQGGQDHKHNQFRPLQQRNSNQSWNNQQYNQGCSAKNQGNRGDGSSQAYNASRAPMYHQGNRSPPYHNQGQQASLSKDNYEQAKEATDFLQPGSSKDKPIVKNFQEKRMQLNLEWSARLKKLKL